jgi:putative sterol carrier protein
VPRYLTQEWLDEFRRLAHDQPARPGTSVKVQYHTTGGPHGDVAYYWVIQDGKILEAQLGEMADADFTISQEYDDAGRIQRGELDATTAFMQGKMKVSGNMPRMMALIPLTNSPEWKSLMQRVAEATEF